MCRLKSGIILKDRVFLPDYDSHTQMLEELDIEDNQKNAERLFVRAELLPPKNDVFAPVENWIFHVDQDIIPDWFIEEIEKQRMVEAVKLWAEEHIHIGKQKLVIETGSNHYIKDCKDVIIYGSATVENIYGSATVENICDSATVENICGSATVENAGGFSIIIGSKYGWKNKDTIILSENATFKDCEAKVIFQSGNWEMRSV